MLSWTKVWDSRVPVARRSRLELDPDQPGELFRETDDQRIPRETSGRADRLQPDDSPPRGGAGGDEPRAPHGAHRQPPAGLLERRAAASYFSAWKACRFQDNSCGDLDSFDGPLSVDAEVGYAFGERYRLNTGAQNILGTVPDVVPGDPDDPEDLVGQPRASGTCARRARHGTSTVPCGTRVFFWRFSTGPGMKPNRYEQRQKAIAATGRPRETWDPG